jgi:pilus assembly protein Flp/PilA
MLVFNLVSKKANELSINACVKAGVFFNEFKNNEKGVTAVEYAIVACAISAIILTVFNGTLEGALKGAIVKITNNIDSAGTVSKKP